VPLNNLKLQIDKMETQQKHKHFRDLENLDELLKSSKEQLDIN